MSKKILFIDFDGTLFDRWAFLQWFDVFLEGYGAKKGQFIASARSFYKANGIYDHKGHLKAIAGREWDFISGEIEKMVKVQGLQFYYGDALKFLKEAKKCSDFEVRVLSYGSPDFQRFKIGLCEEVIEMNMPVHITQRQKKDFIINSFNKGQEGILVDDKHPLGLPKGWLHIWVNRSEDSGYNKTHLSHSAYENEVSTLTEAAKIIKEA